MDYKPTNVNRAERFNEAFFGRALTLLHDYCREELTAGALPDARFIRLGLRRCLDHYDSGRDFLQELADTGEPLARATFFDALHQPRRLTIVTEVATRLAAHAAQELAEVDWLASGAWIGRSRSLGGGWTSDRAGLSCFTRCQGSARATGQPLRLGPASRLDARVGRSSG